MFTCRDVAQHASDYHDRALTPWARVKMRLHLFICEDCRRYVDQIGRMPGLLRDAFRTDEDAASRVLDAAKARLAREKYHPRHDG